MLPPPLSRNPLGSRSSGPASSSPRRPDKAGEDATAPGQKARLPAFHQVPVRQHQQTVAVHDSVDAVGDDQDSAPGATVVARTGLAEGAHGLWVGSSGKVDFAVLRRVAAPSTYTLQAPNVKKSQPPFQTLQTLPRCRVPLKNKAHYLLNEDVGRPVHIGGGLVQRQDAGSLQ